MPSAIARQMFVTSRTSTYSEWETSEAEGLRRSAFLLYRFTEPQQIPGIGIDYVKDSDVDAIDII